MSCRPLSLQGNPSPFVVELTRHTQMPKAAIVIAPAPAARLARFQARSHPRRLACYLQACEQRHCATRHPFRTYHPPSHDPHLYLPSAPQHDLAVARQAHAQAKYAKSRNTGARISLFSETSCPQATPTSYTRAQAAIYLLHAHCTTLEHSPPSRCTIKAPLSTHHHPSRLPHCTSHTPFPPPTRPPPIPLSATAQRSVGNRGPFTCKSRQIGNQYSQFSERGSFTANTTFPLSS